MVLLCQLEVLLLDGLDVDGLRDLRGWYLQSLEASEDLILHLRWHLVKSVGAALVLLSGEESHLVAKDQLWNSRGTKEGRRLMMPSRDQSVDLPSIRGA